MTIATSVPSTVRRPGTFQQLDVTSSARGLVPIQRRVALLGAKIAAGTAVVSVPIQIFSEGQADALFGAGSELALMCRGSIRAGGLYGSSPEISAWKERATIVVGADGRNSRLARYVGAAR